MPVVTCPHCANPVTLPDQWTSPGFLCPHCHRATAFAAPAPIPLPAQPPAPLPLPDDEPSQPVRPARMRAGARASRNRQETEARGKTAIVLGYAAFVLIPAVAVIALAVYKFGGDEKPNAPVAQHSIDEQGPSVKKPDPVPKRLTRRPPRSDKQEDDTRDAPIPQPRANEKTGDPTASDPDQKTDSAVTVAIAPEPHPARIVPASPVPEPIAIAPEPRVVRPGFAPPPGFVSDWQQIDEVEARVAGVAITRVPITDVDGRAVDSPVAVLAIWVEVRTRTTARTVELKRWQDSLGSYAEVATARGLQLGRALLGPGASLRTGLPYKQVVPADGTPRTDIVVFATPPDDPGDLRLVLDAERVGEMGKFKITIPAKALKK